VIRRALRLFALGLAGLLLLAAARIVAGKLAGPHVLARAERDFARHVGPLELAAWAPGHLPAEQNGALALWHATDAIAPWPGGGIPPLSRVLLSEGVSEPNLLDEAISWTSRNRETLAALRRLVDFPWSSFGDPRDRGLSPAARESLEDPLRFLLPIRLLLADAGLALHAGDRRRVLEDLAAMRVITVMLRREPILLTHGVSGALEQQTLGVAHAVLRTEGDAVAAGVAAEIAALAAAPGLRHALAGEALLAREWLRRMVSEEGSRPGRRDSWPDLLEPFTADHYVADHLAATTRVVRGMATPAPRWPERWTNPPELWPQLVALVWPLAPAPLAGVSIQTLGFHYAEAEQFLLSSRRLGEIATRLAGRTSEAPPLAELPGGEAPLPWSDEPPRIERRADGGWTVSAPAGIRKVWAGYREEGSIPRSWFEARERLLRWEVPPPSPSPEVPGELQLPAPPP